jgi:hydrogenase-4 component E
MIDAVTLDGAIKILFVFVLFSAALIITRRDFATLVSSYMLQSLILVFIALTLFFKDFNLVLIGIAVLTLLSKVIVIPYVIHKIRKRINIPRDLTFHFLSPTGSLIVSVFLFIIIYLIFDKIIPRTNQQSDLFFFGCVIGISLTMMGMLVLFSRKKAMTKVIGYLTMENGVLLFSIFMAEIPFIIEVLLMLDLIMLIVLITILTIGIDSNFEQYHEQLTMLRRLLGEDEP